MAIEGRAKLDQREACDGDATYVCRAARRKKAAAGLNLWVAGDAWKKVQCRPMPLSVRDGCAQSCEAPRGGLSSLSEKNKKTYIIPIVSIFFSSIPKLTPIYYSSFHFIANQWHIQADTIREGQQ